MNPFLYQKKFRDYLVLYIPYRHQFKLIRDKKFFDRNKENLKKERILVDQDYKDNFLKFYRKILNKPPFLDLMYLIITDACNFNCQYCFVENNFLTSKRKSMSWTIAKKGIDYFFSETKSKNPRIIFYGGEPLLNQNILIQSIKYIREKSKDARIGINSNGSIFTSKLADTFRKYKVNLSISVDGFDLIHNKTRTSKSNKKTYDIIKKNIEKYLAKQVCVSFSITINCYNIDYLPAIAKWIIKEFPKVRSVGFNLPLQNIKGNKLFVDPEYCAFQIYNAFRIFRRYGIYEDRIMRRLDYIIKEKIYLKDCAGCGNQIVVLPDGAVGPCHGFMGLRKYFINHIKKLDFKNERIFKEWNQISPINKKDCVNENCPFLLICGNACPYYSFITKGSLLAKDERIYPFLTVLIDEMTKDLYLKKPKAVFVDYDGVIISRKSSLEILNFIAKKIGYKEEIQKRDYYDVRKILTEVAKKINYLGNINDLLYLYMKYWKRESVINEPLLKQLRKLNLPVYILTNSSNISVREELKDYYSMFQGIFGKDSSGFKKPDPKFFDFVFKAVELKPEEIVYIGDDYFNDIKPIYRLGIRAAISSYANPEYSSYLDNDWIVDIFEDLNEKR